MTRERPARRVRVGRSTIVVIEGGMHDPSVGLEMRITDASRVPVECVSTLEVDGNQVAAAARGKSTR